MNEQIKSLMAQAGIHQPERFDAIDGSNQLQKFAELIVQECLDILDDEDDGGYEGRSVRIATLRIKQHFGVEE